MSNQGPFGVLSGFVRSGDRIQDLAGTDLKALGDALRAIPFLDGHSLGDLSLTSGTAYTAEHKLKRVPNGVLVFYQSAAGFPIITASSKTSITFTATATATYRLWVF